MRIVIIGGTRLIGKHFVPAALSRGHTLTLFNRGLTHPGAFDGVEEIHGDRDGGLAALEGREWDCALDTCGFVPRVVGLSAQMLSASTGHYTFISSESVYANDRTAGEDETAPVAELPTRPSRR
jgi:2'-hydroxyisoflavone reductase